MNTSTTTTTATAASETRNAVAPAILFSAGTVPAERDHSAQPAVRDQHHLLPNYLRPFNPVTASTSVAAKATQEKAASQNRDTLYGEFQPLVQRLIRKYGDNAELRKDLEGEIYCLFCNLLEAYDDTRGVPLKPYLVHQLTTSVYTLARRRWRQERREICMEVREETISPANPAQDPSDEWDQQIAMEQVRAMLPKAIANLPQRQRQVVIWRYYEHRSFEDIAEALNVRVATTRSLLRHGLNNLRRAFAEANLPFEFAE